MKIGKWKSKIFRKVGLDKGVGYEKELVQATGERELGVVQEARTWHPIPIWVNLLHRSAKPIHERIWSGAHHKISIQFLSTPRKVTGSRKIAKGLSAFTDVPLSLRRLSASGSDLRQGKVLPPYRVLRQGSAQVSQFFSESIILQIRHTQSPIAWMLTTDLSTDDRPSTSPNYFGEGSL